MQTNLISIESELRELLYPICLTDSFKIYKKGISMLYFVKGFLKKAWYDDHMIVMKQSCLYWIVFQKCILVEKDGIKT